MEHGTSSTSTNNKAPSSGEEARVVRCPRCDSADTKFCYYNNYSTAQPRHLCKTCRRYWTKGGSIRNVPVGSGCRKNKKLKSSTSAILNFFPAVDLAGLSSPRLHFSSWFGAPDPSGNNYSPVLSGAIPEMMSYSNTDSFSMASSIWSCTNQELLQQRLSLLFGNGGGRGGDKDHRNVNCADNSPVAPQQKLLEQASEIDAATEWFFGNSYTNFITTGGGDGNDIEHPRTILSSWNNGFEAYTTLFDLP